MAGSRRRVGNFSGSLDEVAAYNYCLTPAQIAAHWAARASVVGGTVEAASVVAAPVRVQFDCPVCKGTGVDPSGSECAWDRPWRLANDREQVSHVARD